MLNSNHVTFDSLYDNVYHRLDKEIFDIYVNRLTNALFYPPFLTHLLTQMIKLMT